MDKKKIAKIISFLLGFVLLPILVIFLIFKTGLTQNQIKIIFPVFTTFIILIPLGFLITFKKINRISDWDIRNRQERYLIFSIFLISTLIGLGFTYVFGNSLLFHLTLILWISAVVAMIITHLWKISLHMSLDTSTVIVINFLFGWHAFYLFLLLPLIGWARYYAKHHSLPQLLAGFVINAAIILIGLHYFGYI